jgi:hypothetical protein
VPSEICRITGGGIVCQDGGQCCDITTGACRTQENGESFTCDSDSDCQQNEECRFCTTDGDNASAAIYKATFGGQVGAPFVIPGCHQNDECVQGNWTHQRHKKHGSLHGPSFYNMVCRCEQADGALTPPGTLCNECSGAGCHDPDYPGPEPRPAPANIACFTGTALWNPTSGRRTLNVAFRVEIEDRGEPGGGNNAGNLEDVYRIRIWYADDATEAAELADAACCLNDIASVTTNIGLPNIIDGGNLVHGNLQIHPRTGNPNNTDFPDQCFAGGGEPE